MAKKRPNQGARRGRDRGATGDDYTGRSGQLAVMAELLMLKCNVAIPEIDRGKDVFAFKEGRREVAHIQVKTGRGKAYKKEEGYRARFSIPKKELGRLTSNAPIYYVLAARLEAEWADYLVMSRLEMAVFYWNFTADTPGEEESSPDFVFVVQFRPTQVICRNLDWTSYRNDWSKLPPLQRETATDSSSDSSRQGTPKPDQPTG